MKKFTFYFYFIMLLLITLQVNGMTNPEYTRPPAEAINPITNTRVKVNHLDITIDIHNEPYNQPATLSYVYTLENTSDTEELLRFTIPLSNVTLLSLKETIELDYQALLIKNQDIDNYAEYIDSLINNEDDIDPLTAVSVYKINAGQLINTIELQNAGSSSIITNINFTRNNDGKSIAEYNTTLTKDLYIIDLNEESIVTLNGNKIGYSFQGNFHSVVKNLIKNEMNNLNEQQLEQYYTYLIKHEDFNKGFIKINPHYFNQALRVNLYELNFNPNEVKVINLTYDFNPTSAVTKDKSKCYTYEINLNNEHWLSFNPNTNLTLNLNETYRYIYNSNVSFVNTFNHSYTGSTEHQESIHFSLYNLNKTPVIGYSDEGIKTLIIIIILFIVVGIPLIILLIITPIIILKKRRIRRIRLHKLDFDIPN